MPEFLSDLPPVHLLFDLGGLLVGKTREWQEFARVGQCFLPQVVFDEIQFLAHVGADHPQEKTAQEFLRFLAGSNWQLTSATAPHPELKAPPGRILGKRSRLALSVAEAAYGVARASTGRLVVLISNDQALLRRVQALGIPNLTGLPVSALLIWSRTGRRPAVVIQHMQQMQERSRMFAAAAPRRRLTTVAAPIQVPVAPRSPAPTLHLGNQYFNALQQMASGASAIVSLAIALSLAWYLVQPRSLNQFLRQHDLPTLPQLPGSK